MEHVEQSIKTVVIAEDHNLVVGALRSIFESLENVHVVAVANNGLDAIAQVKAHKPDLLTLDIALPLANGVEVLTEIRRWSPDTKTAVVTGLTSMQLLSELHERGVQGVFLKSDSAEDLSRGLAAVLGGEQCVSRAVSERLENTAGQSNLAALTDRERQVLAFVADGLTNAAIGDRLSISAKTVDKHRTSLMKKLGVHSAAELLSLALREGLLDHHQTL